MSGDKDNVGVPAEVGDLVFFRYHDVLAPRGQRLWIAGICTAATPEGRANRMQAFDGKAHNSIGVESVIVLSRNYAGIDFPKAVAALKRRGGKGFRSKDTAERFLAPFLRPVPSAATEGEVVR